MILLVVGLLIFLALMGMPLFGVLAVGGIYASMQADIDPTILIVEMNRVATSPNLIAIPLFTLAGMTMAAGGAPQRMIRLSNAIFGWMPGGLAIVAVVSCAFFTAFSGASGVTILALGGLLCPMLLSVGYPGRFTYGLLTSSGSLGLLFPPSIAVLLYGVVAGVNIDDLFLAGVAPGLLLLGMLALYSYFTGLRSPIVQQPFSLHELIKEARVGIWDIALPLFILVGIFGGFVTLTEAAALTAAYVLFVEVVLFGNINLRHQLIDILVDTSILVGSILIILGAAIGLTNLLIDAEIPMKMLAFVETHIDSPVQFLIFLNLLLLVVGAMMDIFSAIMVVVPLLLPLASRYGIDPIHLGIIFLANLEIGYTTPPVGINLFIASQRFNKPIHMLFRASLPFLGIMLVWLIILTYVPSLSLWWRD